MTQTLLILHTAPDAPDNRAFTAIRLAGALLADDKAVTLFLVEDGAWLVDPKLAEDNPCRALFYELLDVGLNVQVCGATLRKLGWDEGYLLPGVNKSSMKALSALMTEADEIVNL
ncbi:MAG: DsrE family protein [Pseudomonadota bacterium]